MQRTRSWVVREYGSEKWPELLGRIEEILAQGEQDLARVISHIQRWKRGAGPSERRDAVLHGERREVASAVAWDGKYGWLAESVIAACQPNTEYIVELGSGWGVNLFNVWSRGGPRHARYVAAELTEAGRQCTRLLASLAPTLDVRTVPFDYHAPEIPAAPAGCAHAVIFTSQSIEQIPEVKPALIDAIASVAPEATVVHVEPVGWQLPPEHRPHPCTGSSRSYAQRHDYNRNLWSLLTEQAAAGRLRLDRVEAEIVGTNPENTVSLIQWRIVRQ